MRRSYRALIIVAALALIAGALSPWLTFGPLADALLSWGAHIAYTSRASVVIVRLLLGAVTLVLSALVTGALTYALVLAAWTRQRSWVIALAVFGALAVLSPLVIYVPLFFGANISTGYIAYIKLYPYSELLTQAAPAVIACVLALVFAVRGWRRADEVASAA